MTIKELLELPVADRIQMHRQWAEEIRTTDPEFAHENDLLANLLELVNR